VFGLIAVILTTHGADGTHGITSRSACRVCGAPVPNEASQCTHCGSKISSAV
jgi:hypothetical protein